MKARWVRPLPSRNGWMGGVDLGQVVGEAVDESLAIQVAQVVLARQLGEHPGQVGLDVLGQREHIGLGNRHGANLPGPGIYVAE